MHEGHHPILEDPQGGAAPKGAHAQSPAYAHAHPHDPHPHTHPKDHDHEHDHGRNHEHDHKQDHSHETAAGSQTRVIAAIIVVALITIFVVWKFF